MLFGKIKNTNEWGFDAFETTFETYVKLSEEEYRSILEEAQKTNKFLAPDKNGKPVLVDPPEPTEKELAENKILELEQYLKQTDWYALRFADTGEEIPADVKKKRQQAREEISELRSL